MSTSPIELESDQRPGWFELFYDLVIVAAIGRGTLLFTENPSWSTGESIGIILAFLFSVWLLTALHYGLFPKDDPVRQFLVLAQMLGIVIASLYLNLDASISDTTMYYALVFAMFCIGIMYLRTALQLGWSRTAVLPAAIGSFASAVTYLVCAMLSLSFAQEGHGLRLLALAGIVLALAPVLTVGIREIVRGGVPNARHLEERLGLLVIIVLGESFAHLISELGSVGGIPNPEFFVLTFAVTFSIWSIYFSSINKFGVPTTAAGLRLWLLMHFVLTYGAVAMAAGLSSLAMIPADDPNPGPHGGWTVLPFIYMISAIAVMTWIEMRRWTAVLVSQAVGIAVLLAMFVGQLAMPIEDRRWWVMAACITVLTEAVVLAVLRVRAGRDRVSPSSA